MPGFRYQIGLLVLSLAHLSIQDETSMVPSVLHGPRTTFMNAYKNFDSYYETQSDKVYGEPLMFFYFGRHTIRYPDEEQITWMNTKLPSILNEFLANYDSEKSSISKKEVDALKKWKPTFDISRAELSTESGIKETMKIGTFTLLNMVVVVVTEIDFIFSKNIPQKVSIPSE